ncbi:MAG TPA: hypothetical protein VI140_07025 [Oxalicibacterium sp.]
MHHPLLLLAFFTFTFSLLTFSPPALAIYKCESGDRIVYSDTPCRSGKTTTLDIDTGPIGDPETAQQRSEQDKKELQRLENARQKEQAADERAYRQRQKAQVSKRKKCDNLALRRKWAEEDAANAHPKSAERARRTAKRAAEKHELECAT